MHVVKSERWSNLLLQTGVHLSLEQITELDHVQSELEQLSSKKDMSFPEALYSFRLMGQLMRMVASYVSKKPEEFPDNVIPIRSGRSAQDGPEQ